MSLFPIFVKLEGRHVLLVGAGPVGEAKVGGLLSAGAVVTVVAPEATPPIRKLAGEGTLVWHAREFRPGDLDGVALVIAAVPEEVARAIFAGGTEPSRPRELGRRSRQLRLLLSGCRRPRRFADRHFDRRQQPGAGAAHPHRARTAVRPRLRVVGSAVGRRPARSVCERHESRGAQGEAAELAGATPGPNGPGRTPEWCISLARGLAIRSCSR